MVDFVSPVRLPLLLVDLSYFECSCKIIRQAGCQVGLGVSGQRQLVFSQTLIETPDLKVDVRLQNTWTACLIGQEVIQSGWVKLLFYVHHPQKIIGTCGGQTVWVGSLQALEGIACLKIITLFQPAQTLAIESSGPHFRAVYKQRLCVAFIGLRVVTKR